MRTKFLNIVALVLALATGSSSLILAADTPAPVMPKARDVAPTITLPAFKLDAVRLDQALRQLQEAGRQHDPKQSGVYFCLSVPEGDETTASIKVSLNLKNVSLAEAADQICRQVVGYELRDYASGKNLALMLQPKSGKCLRFWF